MEQPIFQLITLPLLQQLWLGNQTSTAFLLYNYCLSHAKQLYYSPTASTSWIPSCLLICPVSNEFPQPIYNSLLQSMYDMITCLKFHSAYIGSPLPLVHTQTQQIESWLYPVAQGSWCLCCHSKSLLHVFCASWSYVIRWQIKSN